MTPAAPAQLVITAQPPSSVTAGAGFGLTVSVEDSYGNAEPTYDGNVSVALARPWRDAHDPGQQRRGRVLRPVARPGR